MKKREGQSDREAAIESLQLALDLVEEGADPDWKVAALAAVEKTCKELREFISDDVWRTGGLDLTRENRALGPVILTARRLGWCDKTGRYLSSTRSHLRPMPIWRSHLYDRHSGGEQ
jgi:hypothetical protein